jgi:TolA-binding protein
MPLKKTLLIVYIGLIASFQPLVAQKQISNWDPETTFQQGLVLFQNQQYGASRSLFAGLQKQLDDPNSRMYIDSRYYQAVSAFYLDQEDAPRLVSAFAKDYPGSSWMPRINFFYAGMLFNDRKYQEAYDAYQSTDANRLSADEQHEMHYKQAYALLQLEEVDQAMTLFEKTISDKGTYSDDARYYAAHIYYVKGNDDQAMKLFAELENNRSYRKQIPLYMLQINYRNGQLDEVIRMGEDALKTADYRRKPEIARMLADAWYARENYDKALSYYQVFERQNRRNLSREDHYQIGVSRMKTGDIVAAIRSFEQLGTPEDSLKQYASYYLAACYVKTNQPKYARNAFLAAYKAGYDDEISEDALFNYARLSLQAGTDPFNEAAKLLTDYLAANEDTDRRAEAESLIIHLYLAARDYDAALASLEKLSNRDPKLQQIYDQLSFSLAVQLFNQGDIQKAADYFNRLQSDAQKPAMRAEATFWLAETFYYQKNYWGSEKYFKQFMAMREASGSKLLPLASYNLGYTYFRKQDYKAALPSFNSFVNKPYVENPALIYDAWLRIGDCHFMLKDYNAAITAYKKVNQANASGGDYALFQVGLAYGALGNINQKMQALDQLLKTYPRSGYFDQALYEMGSSYLVNNDNRSAIVKFDQLVREKPRSNYARQALMKTGMIYYNNNQNEQALTKLKQVVSRYPGTNESREALNLMRDIYMDMNKLQEYFAYTEALGVGQVSNTQQDSLAFVTAENFYLENRCEEAQKALSNYFSQFDNGAYLLQAHHYAAQCALRSKNNEKALFHLEFLINFQDNSYTDEALLNAARIVYDQAQYGKAATYYGRLAQISEEGNRKREAIEGSMKSNYFQGDYQKAIGQAKVLQLTPDVEQQQRVQADYILGKSYMSLEQYSLAKPVLQLCVQADPGVYGAEAAYLLALAHFKLGEAGLAEDKVFAMADRYPSFEYWLAKSYILLADIYAANDNAFQARETLKSIIDNYSGDDLKQEAIQKLQQLESKQ